MVGRAQTSPLPATNNLLEGARYRVSGNRLGRKPYVNSLGCEDVIRGRCHPESRVRPHQSVENTRGLRWSFLPRKGNRCRSYGKTGILSDDEELRSEIGSDGESDNASADDTNSSGSSTKDGDVPFMSDASMVTSTDDEVSMTSSIIPDDHAVGFDDEEYEDMTVWEYVEDEEEQPRKRLINRDCKYCFTCPHCNQSNRVLAADRHAVPATLDQTSTPILTEITTTTHDHITSILDKPTPDLDDTSRDGHSTDVPELDANAPPPPPSSSPHAKTPSAWAFSNGINQGPTTRVTKVAGKPDTKAPKPTPSAWEASQGLDFQMTNQGYKLTGYKPAASSSSEPFGPPVDTLPSMPQEQCGQEVTSTQIPSP